MTTEKDMRDAAPHIRDAIRCLEMLLHYTENKEKLSLAKRVPVYYEKLVDSVLKLQEMLLTDNEYTERVNLGLHKISGSRVLSYNVTSNNDGDIFYSIDGMLPLRSMKENVLFNRKVEAHVRY